MNKKNIEQNKQIINNAFYKAGKGDMTGFWYC